MRTEHALMTLEEYAVLEEPEEEYVSELVEGVEVLSPSDTSTSMQRKTLDYLGAGARLVWILDPVLRTVIVHRSDGSARILREGETLEGEDVLAGFAAPLTELFD